MVEGDRVLLAATVMVLGLSECTRPVMFPSKGKWPPTCSITCFPFTHCSSNKKLCLVIDFFNSHYTSMREILLDIFCFTSTACESNCMQLTTMAW